jgi:hypothetical protein
MRAYRDMDSPAHSEEDHLILLAPGGASREPRNLWPQLRPSPDEKVAAGVALGREEENAARGR